MPSRSAVTSIPSNIRKTPTSRFFGLLLLLSAGVGLYSQTQVRAVAPPTAKSACSFTEPQIDGATDVEGLQQYKAAIANLLAEERFDDLDCIAHQARVKKTRLPGGAWKLIEIYAALEAPKGHAIEQDWTDHLALLNRWVAASPESITARIAVANSYVSYAWNARGDGTSDTVTGNGWNLFNERLEKAKNILDAASMLPEKCPEWYLAMQNIALGQNWDLQQESALFQQAIAFEPEYYSYYRAQVVLLLPQWYGEEGDTAAFANRVADQVGGKKGDLLYFQIAAKLACACDKRETKLNGMSWERMQKGFAATEETYGTSMTNLNSFASMAVNFRDYVAADSTFKRIGGNWDKEVWITETWFEQNRDNAAQFAPVQARNHEAQKEADANMQTVEGQAYRKEVQRKLGALEQACLDQAKGNADKFEVNLKIAENGSAEDARGKQAPDSFGLCLLRALYVTQATKQTPFPPPPHASYWVPVEFDPADAAVSTK